MQGGPEAIETDDGDGRPFAPQRPPTPPRPPRRNAIAGLQTALEGALDAIKAQGVLIASLTTEVANLKGIDTSTASTISQLAADSNAADSVLAAKLAAAKANRAALEAKHDADTLRLDAELADATADRAAIVAATDAKLAAAAAALVATIVVVVVVGHSGICRRSPCKLASCRRRRCRRRGRQPSSLSLLTAPPLLLRVPLLAATE